MNNSPFSMGWLMAMFDLPVMTDKERKMATHFRNDLIDHGFLMIQFSVYARPCVNFEQLSTSCEPSNPAPRSSLVWRGKPEAVIRFKTIRGARFAAPVERTL